MSWSQLHQNHQVLFTSAFVNVKREDTYLVSRSKFYFLNQLDIFQVQSRIIFDTPCPLCPTRYTFPNGTAHSFLLADDRYLGNRDSDDLMVEIWAGPGNGGGCTIVVADPLHIKETLISHSFSVDSSKRFKKYM